MSSEYIYLFTRSDLSRQQQIIQTAHAIHEVGIRREYDELNKVPNAVLIDVKSENDLLEIVEYLENNKIEYEMFYEPDISAHTAIATYPIKGDDRKHFRHFNLM